jgi:hypothetical protein
MSKICSNCGAPFSMNSSESCKFCGNSLKDSEYGNNIEQDFLLIQYEFAHNNFKKVVNLSDEYLKKDKKNIPLWTYKILAETYDDGFKGAINYIARSLKTLFEFGIFNSNNRLAVEQILHAEFTSKFEYMISDAESKRDSLTAISILEKYLSDDFIYNLKHKIESVSVNTDIEISFEGWDPLLFEAATLIVENQIGYSSLIQRRMKLGYNRAGRLMDQLEAIKIVGPSMGSKSREVYINDIKELSALFKQNNIPS